MQGFHAALLIGRMMPPCSINTDNADVTPLYTRDWQGVVWHIKHRCCSYSRTPVDEALGRPFQDAIVAAVNSFYKQPIVEVGQRQGDEANDDQQEGDIMEEDEVRKQ